MSSKIRFLVGVCFLFPLVVQAQISITQQHLPRSGDTLRYSNGSPVSLPDLSKTGANQTWDFSKLNPVSQGVYEYKSSTQTPYIINFGFSAIGLKIADTLGADQLQIIDVYNFFRKTATVWNNVGIGFRYASFPLPQSGRHTDEEELYKLPMTFRDSSVNTFKVQVPIVLLLIPAGNFFQSGTRETIVDGWGTISTPYGSNISCLRVKSIVNQRDSVSITQPALNFGFPTRRIEYKWLSTTERIPVLEITGTEVGGVFTPTIIRYRDQYREIQSPLAPVVDFSASPLTANTGSTVQFSDLSNRNPSQWLWSINPSTGWQWASGSSASAQNPAVVFQQEGKYSVSLRASNLVGASTTSKTDFIEIKKALSMNETALSSFRAYPVPADKVLYLDLPANAKMVMVYDGKGKLMLMQPVENRKMVLDTELFPSGLIQVVIFDGTYTSTEKILVQH